ncbi:WD40 repeat-like protein [Histomonas meleagridis]|uniref:WD40 repeat-like protein n=1 Tax=Histomonas meleagridis TaxID=135588 RepID=UPI003559D297|nr:WD40 repeat-like protein [Histomonas meleagridis]KAH0803725.1 WD40 repeat-like protein [Histomonas meleagridis]
MTTPLFSNPILRSEIKTHVGSIWTLASSPSGKYIASAGEDKRVVVCGLSETYPYIYSVCSLSGHDSDVVHLAWKDDNTLMSSSLDSTVKFWKISTGELIDTFNHDSAVTTSAINPNDPNIFIACTFNMTAVLWDIRKHSIIKTFYFNSLPTAVSFSPDGSHIAIGCFNGFCHIYRTSDFSRITQFIVGPRHKKRMHGKKITSILFLDNERFLIASNDSRIRMYSTDNFSLIRKYVGHKSKEAQLKLSLSPDKNFIMTTSEEDGSVFIWPIEFNTSSSSKLFWKNYPKNRSKTFEGFKIGKKMIVNSAVFANWEGENNPFVVVCDNDGKIYTIVSE